MTEPLSPPSRPPSQPRPSRRSFAEENLDDRAGRFQLFGALLVPFVLVAGALYVWRRPRADDSAARQPAAASASAVSSASAPAEAPPPAASAPPAPKVKVGEVRVLSCHDGKKKKTPPEQCDHVAVVEQGLVKAVEAAAACLPESAGAGSIEYALDVSFNRKKAPLVLTLPRAGRTYKSGKAVAPCAQAVRARLAGVSLEGAQHTHARYKLAVSATYGGGG